MAADRDWRFGLVSMVAKGNIVQTLSQRYPHEMLPIEVIQLSKGYFAIIDPEDSKRVNNYGWSVQLSEWACYAQTAVPDRVKGWAKKHKLYMHQLITGYARVDHINGNGLDNRRVNLRDSTASQNGGNTLPHRQGKTSIYKGVYWNKRRQVWIAQITVTYKTRYLGSFDDPIEAALAYDNAALESYGEYALTNGMLGLL